MYDRGDCEKDNEYNSCRQAGMIAIENEGIGIVEAWMRFRHGKARKLSRKIKKKTEAGCVEFERSNSKQ